MIALQYSYVKQYNCVDRPLCLVGLRLMQVSISTPCCNSCRADSLFLFQTLFSFFSLSSP
jgi:hypothetical protein